MAGASSSRPDPSRSLSISVSHLWLLVPWVGLGIAAFRPIGDNSFLWHIRAGSVQHELGAVLTSDPFSLTFAEQSWRTQSWIVELLFARLEDLSGIAFVPVWVLGSGLIVYCASAIRLARITTNVRAIGVGLIALMWVALGFMVPRPVIVSFVFLALLMLMIDGKGMRWAIPLVIWIWAASHGSFVLGIGLLVLESLRRRSGQLMRFGVVGLVVASLTAHGIHVWGILFRFLSNRDALSLIAEWATPSVSDLEFLPFFLGVGGLFWNAVSGRIVRSDLWVILPFVAYALTSRRSVFPAMLVLLPWMLTWRGERLDGSVQPRGSVVPVVAAALMIVVPFFFASQAGELSDSEFPVEAVQYLSDSPLFHDDYVGGYLIWAKWPDIQVYVDDRAELYGGAFYRSVANARTGGPDWNDILEESEFDQVLLRTEDPLIHSLAESGWQEVMRDGPYSLMTQQKSVGP